MPQKKHKRNVSLPQIWYTSFLKKQEDREKSRVAMTQQIYEALYRLDKKYHLEEVYIFGSVVGIGRFCRNSDVDIAVKGLDKFDYYEFIAEISELLDKRVDVISLEECHFADSIKEKGIKWNRKSKL